MVAADRAGLLADTAAALADEGLTVLAASVATWAERDIALHSLTVRSRTGDARLGRPGPRAVRGRRRAPRRTTADRPGNRGHAESGADRTLVKVTAPDGLGLLETISRWFADRDISIEAAEIDTRRGTATDRFLVDGDLDRVARPPPQPSVDLALVARPPPLRVRPHPVSARRPSRLTGPRW